MEEDDDAGLLDSYDENSDSDDNMAVDMDNFAKELDSSILYTTLDEVKQVSISSLFYARIFRTNFFLAAFL